MYLGIEIGGTKLQLGVGDGSGRTLRAFERLEVDPRQGATAIRAQIERVGAALVEQFDVQAIGIGFGGPVDSQHGVVTTSHQVSGWNNFPLRTWCERQLRQPTMVRNDCDSAALAEARYGAGQGSGRVFYITVGTGVGGGFVVDGQLQGTGRPAASEIGHVRPGLACRRPDATVESIASGWGIVATVRRRLAAAGSRQQQATRHRRQPAGKRHEADLLRHGGGALDGLTAKCITQAALEGNPIARRALGRATRVLGWAVAQMVTLLSPEVVVIGGGVSLMDRALFLAPIRKHARQYVFPPLADAFEIVPAALGEQVVVHGALELAKDLSLHEPTLDSTAQGQGSTM